MRARLASSTPTPKDVGTALASAHTLPRRNRHGIQGENTGNRPIARMARASSDVLHLNRQHASLAIGAMKLHLVHADLAPGGGQATGGASLEVRKGMAAIVGGVWPLQEVAGSATAITSAPRLIGTTSVLAKKAGRKRTGWRRRGVRTRCACRATPRTVIPIRRAPPPRPSAPARLVGCLAQRSTQAPGNALRMAARTMSDASATSATAQHRSTRTGGAWRNAEATDERANAHERR